MASGGKRARLTGALLAALAPLGCYHFAFDLPRAGEVPRAGAASPATVTYTERVPTYVNGFVGTGRVDASRYCSDPIRTELRVTAADVLLSMATLLIYTPHTLSVTCPSPHP
jgi:hypothetical protein